MVTMQVTIHGVPETLAAFQQFSTILMTEMDQATRASLFQVARTAQKDYLSGPRPQKLGVITNRLRGSLSEGKPGFLLDVTTQRLQITGTVGTNVTYAAIHESDTDTVIRPTHGKFLAVPTAFAKTPAGALKDQYNKPLRQIEGLFLQRTKTGLLFAATKSVATGRQRSSRLTPLFWLVRSVTIPSRPFLNPALQDSVPWIQTRFDAAGLRVESKLQALRT